MIKLVFGLIFLLVLSAAGFVGWYFYMKLRFKTVSSNEALIITGTNLGNPDKEPNVIKDDSGRYMKIIRGGGHRLRMFQTANTISLKSFQLKLETPKVYTKEGVGLYGQAVATIKVADNIKSADEIDNADEIGGIVQYAEQFLGKKQDEIESEIAEVLESNLRAILSSMTVEEINKSREHFNEEVREVAQKQLNRMGFQITSLGLTDLKDDDGYLENLGRPEVARVLKIAEIAEAENIRETELKQAEVNEEVAKEKYSREISIAESRKEKDLNDAKILAQTEKERAAAEASYELELEQRKLDIEKQKLEIREQDKANELKLREMERENEVRLQERQVELEEKQVQVRKQQADAEYYAKTRAAEASAEAEKLAGEAEAEVIRKRSEAEVEALKKRAEAMNKHKEVMITEKVIEMLPQYAQAISSSLANVESIRILDGGGGDQVRSLPNTVTGMMANMNEGLGQMTGIDLNEVIHNFTNGNKEVDMNELVNELQKATHKEDVSDELKDDNDSTLENKND